MFLLTLQTLLQQYLPTATFWIKNKSLYFEHENLVGIAKITENVGYAFVDQIYIKLSQQRIGMGSRILELLIIACQQHGLTYIECFPTQGGTLHGKEFCQKHGFHQRKNNGNWFKIV
jgi:hypothetical protein